MLEKTIWRKVNPPITEQCDAGPMAVSSSPIEADVFVCVPGPDLVLCHIQPE